MPAKQSAEFKKAIEESRKLKQKPTDDELLKVRISLGNRNSLVGILICVPSQLYGLFKEGSQDPPIADSTAPGMFELKVSFVDPRPG